MNFLSADLGLEGRRVECMFTKSNTKFLNTDLFAQRKHLVPPGLSHTSGYEILDNLHHLVDLGVFICKSSLAESLRVSSKRYTPSFLGKENDSFAGNYTTTEFLCYLTV